MTSETQPWVKVKWFTFNIEPKAPDMIVVISFQSLNCVVYSTNMCIHPVLLAVHNIAGLEGLIAFN